jgi:DNA-binding IclR family transcriptional regulator
MTVKGDGTHMPQQDTHPVKALARGFQVVETIREMDGAGVSELADELSMPKSTVHDYLRTLTDIEYLVKMDDTYHVGARFLGLGEYARRRMEIYHTARPEIDKLAEETGEHANVMIEEHGMGIFLYRSKGKDAVNLETHSGMRVPLQTTSLGKAILAHMPESRVDEIVDEKGLPSMSGNTISDRDELERELEENRQRGYSVNDEELFPGIRAVGVPIIKEGRVVAAISVSGPVSRLQGDRFDEDLPQLVKNAANVIEVNLVHSDQGA